MKMTYAEAVKDAMRCEMLKDPSVFLAGEDISVMGGSFGCSAGLFKEFGPKRIVNTPISETAILGLGVSRPWLGDVLVTEDGAYVLCLPSVAVTLLDQL